MHSMREQQDLCVGRENGILVKIAQKVMNIPEIREVNCVASTKALESG